MLAAAQPTQTGRDLTRCEMNQPTSTQNNLPRIVLVDDHPAVLRQTVQLISSRFKIVAALSDGGELISLATKKEVDLIVLDITLPGLRRYSRGSLISRPREEEVSKRQVAALRVKTPSIETR